MGCSRCRRNPDLSRPPFEGFERASVYSAGEGFVWQLEPTVWEQHACAVAGRTLTEREWELYLPGEPYDPACAD